MREIKFRQENLSVKLWHYWGFIGDVFIAPLDKLHGGISYHYTGLHDKKGNEVFEGDIVIVDIIGEALKYNNLNELTYIITLENGCFGFRPTHPHLVHKSDSDWRPFYNHEDSECFSNTYYEVIGNIYDNPELLKQGE